MKTERVDRVGDSEPMPTENSCFFCGAAHRAGMCSARCAMSLRATETRTDRFTRFDIEES